MRKNQKHRFTIFFCSLWIGVEVLGGQLVWGAKKEELCVISIENVTRGEDYPDTDAVEDAVNAITIPAIQCKIDIVNVPVYEHLTRVETMAAGRGQIDIINTGLTTSLSQLVSEGILIPLDELLWEHGAELMHKEKALVEAAMINGKIYAVPANLYTSKSMGIGYNHSIAEKYGIKLKEGMTMEELTEVGKVLKEHKIYLTSHGDGKLTVFPTYYDLEDFGGDLNYGVIYDPLVNAEIVNAYESRQYKEYCKTVKSWREKGYIPSDSIFGGENYFYEEKAFYQWTSVSPATERIIQAKQLGFSQVLLALTENRLSTSSILEGAWGITSFCKEPEKAMEWLNLLYTDHRIAELMQNGLEGKQYERVSEKVIRHAKKTSDGKPGYGTSFSTFGDGSQISYYEPATEDFHKKLESFNQEARPSLTLGYLFNVEGLEAEIAAVSSVTAEYRPILETGMADDVENLLQEFNSELKEAGIERIIEENVRQLNQWEKRKETVQEKRRQYWERKTK